LFRPWLPGTSGIRLNLHPPDSEKVRNPPNSVIGGRRADWVL